MNETCYPFSKLEENEMNLIEIQPDQQTDTLSATETVVKKFEARLQLIRDRVGSVSGGYKTGVYIVGRPGTSKTFTVKEELEQLDRPWVIKNARMTPMGGSVLIQNVPPSQPLFPNSR